MQPDTLCAWHAMLRTMFNRENEKALRETQTLRAGCSKAEPKFFALLQTPSRGHGMARI